MPNHITTKICIGADEETRNAIRTLMDTKEEAEANDSKEGFDFNAIIPMPKELTEYSTGFSTIRGERVEIWKTRNIECNLADHKEAILNAEKDEHDDYPVVINGQTEYIRGYEIKNAIEAIEEGKETITFNVSDAVSNGVLAEMIANFGTSSWYDWSITNWGTKWNSYDVYWHSDNSVVEIQTAWSTPEPVIVALSQKFPEAKFACLYADEDIGSNCGVYVLQNGEHLADIYAPKVDEDLADVFALLFKEYDIASYGDDEEDEWEMEIARKYEEAEKSNSPIIKLAESDDVDEILTLCKML